ncbi:YqhR family membrane protein [Paenibacillus sp. 2TAB19]|uniref:YqhR family membrane protein n=1 Tax=Paenibacillus sp. 2TAB19 TaxID=3233003 RepID=UPI003F9D5564
MSTLAKNKRSDQEVYSDHHTNPWTYPMMIGLYAGIIWGGLRWVFYQIKFTTVLPGFIGDPFFKQSFLRTGWGGLAGVGCYVLFSIAAALLYKLVLGKLRGPWPGIGYGVFWWALIFLLLGPMLGMTASITKSGWNTLFTEICVFILWGLFVGYSIAFEFTDEASREPIPAPT